MLPEGADDEGSVHWSFLLDYSREFLENFRWSVPKQPDFPHDLFGSSFDLLSPKPQGQKIREKLWELDTVDSIGQARRFWFIWRVFIIFQIVLNDKWTSVRPINSLGITEGSRTGLRVIQREGYGNTRNAGNTAE